MTTFRKLRRLRFADYLENVNRLKEKVTQANDVLVSADHKCKTLGQQALEIINDLVTTESFGAFLEDPTNPPEDEDEAEILRRLKAQANNLARCVSSLDVWYDRYIDAYGKLMDVEDDYHTEKRNMDKAKQEHEDYLSERVI